MTTDHWLAVALVIATLLTSSPLWEFVRSRISRSKPTKPAPETNQPKTRMQKIGGWLIRRLRSPWELPLLGVLLNGYVLVTELHRNTPVTRAVVFRIAVVVALVVFSVLSMSESFIWRAIGELWDDSIKDGEQILHLYESVNKQAELAKEQADLMGKQADLLHGQVVDLNTMVKAVLAIATIAKPEKSPGSEDR